MLSPLNDSVHLFQIALTPAFLLTGTAAIMGIMSSRLAGLLERSRLLNQALAGNADESFVDELALLDKCCILLYRAFLLCLSSAFFTCLVIGFIFSGHFIPAYLASGVFIIIFFTLSIICLTTSIFLLIYETIIGKKLLFFITKFGHQIQ